MGSKRVKPLSAKAALPFKTGNKFRRQDLHVKQKKAKDSQRRDERFKRKREEDRDPELRRERLAKNVPITIDKKRVWDEVDGDDLGISVDVEQLKRRRIEEAEAAEQEALQDEEEGEKTTMRTACWTQTLDQKKTKKNQRLPDNEHPPTLPQQPAQTSTSHLPLWPSNFQHFSATNHLQYPKSSSQPH
jgi:hypothetical protein